MGVAQLLQDGSIGRRTRLGAADDGQVEFLEEHLPQLFGRVQIERMPRVPVDVLFQLANLRSDVLGHLLEIGHIYEHAVHLHVFEHGHQGDLELFVQLKLVAFDELSPHNRVQAQSHVGIRAGVHAHGLNGHLVHGGLGAAFTDDF